MVKREPVEEGTTGEENRGTSIKTEALADDTVFSVGIKQEEFSDGDMKNGGSEVYTVDVSRVKAEPLDEENQSGLHQIDKEETYIVDVSRVKFEPLDEDCQCRLHCGDDQQASIDSDWVEMPESKNIKTEDGRRGTLTGEGKNSPFFNGPIADTGLPPLKCPKKSLGDGSDASEQLTHNHLALHGGDYNISRSPNILKRTTTDKAEENLPEEFQHISIELVRKSRTKRLFKCDICKKAFWYPSKLKRHFRTVHTSNKPYHCDTCDRAFSFLSQLNEHKVVHSHNRSYKCDICEKAFYKQSNLTRHLIVHSHSRPYQCDICEKAFNKRCNLKRHVIVHSDDRPYQCDICENAFNHPSALKRHHIVHSGHKPYQCDNCEKAFTRRSALMHHHQTVHSDHKP